MKLFIVTGASRGLGAALLRKLMRPGHALVGVARGGAAKELQEQARERGADLRWVACDLSEPDRLEPLLSDMLLRMRETVAPPEMACLINNAGVLQPVAPAHRCEGSELIRNVNVNLIAPMVLTAGFIRLTAGWAADRRVLNVSSGAGKKPYFGWSGYCASKAGLDMFTRCVGEEQRDEGSGVRILSVAPGVVDTGMQEEIRGTPAERFREVERFKRLRESGQLLSPDEAAERLLRLLFDNRHPTGSVLDIRDLA